MADDVQELSGVKVLVCDAAGPAITTVQDALDLIGASYVGAEIVAVPADRLDDRFFVLSTGFAGEVMQKFVNYRVRLAVLGDISRHLEASSALRSLVHESNASDHIWFLPDVDALTARLGARA
ncbi:DUF4180 domain-containing protein [Kitasatospora sp. SUK 42]|uniref:DUF4180 domain-containing protein n=1 Tax=Kitasatospora sp. SUK 42 TaxID=1588882 RepID=UPI001C31DECC|nr:DUF4180 domain-containing protein [Kitasatospora sp. SUK 42]MBV2155582.1 DUF4180 domain-containing protein [Kitasatospora sp. SUK 42]